MDCLGIYKKEILMIGDITGGDINISGKVEGTIISDDLLNIHQSAVINGTIEYTSLKVSYGARVQGKIQHKGVGCPPPLLLVYRPPTHPADEMRWQQNFSAKLFLSHLCFFYAN